MLQAIRLTNLIPKILAMVDEKKMAFTIGVELSYLSEEEQYELHAVMDLEQCTPSLSQANRMKRMSQRGELDMDAIYSVLEEEKPNQREQIKIRADKLDDYFPDGFTPMGGITFGDELAEQNDFCGKYGDMWKKYMHDNRNADYRHYLFTGKLNEKAKEINEQAYEMLDVIMYQYMNNYKLDNPESTIEMWKLREGQNAGMNDI